MTEQLQLRRGTAAQVAAFTGAQGEVVVDTTNNRAVINDGATAGGWPAAKLAEVITNTRAAISDAAYSALATDRLVAYVALTAARAVALPAASAFPTGTRLTIVDETGNCSATKTITVNRAGSDTIDGAASFVVNAAYGGLELESNGSNAWTILSPRPNLQACLIGVGAAPDPNNVISAYGASALFSSAGSFNITINKASVGATASLIFEDGFSGRAQMGLAGSDNFSFKVSPNGSAWTTAIAIDATTGVVSAPAGGFNFQQSVGNRTRLRNAAFAINQRNLAGTVTLSAGQYGHDGVKGGASGCSYTFSTSGLDTTLTISAGSLILPIEAALIEGGAYTVSNAGGAQARVWQGTGSSGSGSYATAPFTATGLTAATQTNLEFATGTVLRPQLEPGVIATAFERRPPAVEKYISQYHYQLVNISQLVGQVNGYSVVVQFNLAIQEMRATPTATLVKTSMSPSTYDLYYEGALVTASGLTLGTVGYGGTSLVVNVQGFGSPGTTLAGGGLVSGGYSNVTVLTLSAEI